MNEIGDVTPATAGCACNLECDRPSDGFTLIEVMIGLVLLIVGMVGLVTLLVVSERSHSLSSELAVANNEIRGLAERIRSLPFDTIATTYTTFPTYTVPGLTDGVATVTVFTDETMNAGDATMLGMPRDLDGDGVAGSVNVAATYLLLPIKLEISWTAQNRRETQSLYLLISEED